MDTRRDFIRNAFLAMGGLSLPGLSAAQLGMTPAGTPPMRFIFMHRGNGLFPKVMVPPSFGPKEMELEKRNAAYEVDLDAHTLPDWMSPLEAHKDNLTILQGLSGKMCTTGHHSWCSSLGVYKANERVSSIKWATVDFELAKLSPSPMQHIELACFPTDGGNARGSLDGIAKGFSARGPQQANYAFGGPGIAVNEIFRSVSANKNSQIKYQLERRVLEFAAGNQTKLAKHLAGIEQRKVGNYANSIQDIRERSRKIDLMADTVRQHVPKLESKYLSNDMNTFVRQLGHTEVLLASLISGETHHSHGTEFPFVVMSGKNSKLNLGRRYVRLPYWGTEGHKTLGNWYTTILNAYGNPIKHFGDFDTSLKFDQSGPIKEFFI